MKLGDKHISLIPWWFNFGGKPEKQAQRMRRARRENQQQERINVVEAAIAQVCNHPNNDRWENNAYFSGILAEYNLQLAELEKIIKKRVGISRDAVAELMIHDLSTGLNMDQVIHDIQEKEDEYLYPYLIDGVYYKEDALSILNQKSDRTYLVDKNGNHHDIPSDEFKKRSIDLHTGDLFEYKKPSTTHNNTPSAHSSGFSDKRWGMSPKAQAEREIVLQNARSDLYKIMHGSLWLSSQEQVINLRRTMLKYQMTDYEYNKIILNIIIETEFAFNHLEKNPLWVSIDFKAIGEKLHEKTTQYMYIYNIQWVLYKRNTDELDQNNVVLEDEENNQITISKREFHELNDISQLGWSKYVEVPKGRVKPVFKSAETTNSTNAKYSQKEHELEKQQKELLSTVKIEWYTVCNIVSLNDIQLVVWVDSSGRYTLRKTWDLETPLDNQDAILNKIQRNTEEKVIPKGMTRSYEIKWNKFTFTEEFSWIFHEWYFYYIWKYLEEMWSTPQYYIVSTTWYRVAVKSKTTKQNTTLQLVQKYHAQLQGQEKATLWKSIRNLWWLFKRDANNVPDALKN